MLTRFPEEEQAYLAHTQHPLAEQTLEALARLRDHACVRTVGDAVAARGFLFVAPHFACLSWPDLGFRQSTEAEPWMEIPELDEEAFLTSLRGFRDEADTFWEKTQPDWLALTEDLRLVLSQVDLGGFLHLFWGMTKGLVAVPNPLVPRTEPTGLIVGDEYYAILPPNMTSPDSAERVAYSAHPLETRWTACHEFCHGPQAEEGRRERLSDEAIARAMQGVPMSEGFASVYQDPWWQFGEVHVRAIQVLYIRHNEGADAEERFIELERKRNGLDSLREWADLLEPYLDGRRSGLYQAWSEYLPIFVENLAQGR